MENINSAQELFVNIRRSIRLLYEYQKRMQGTMFHIKSVLNFSPGGKIVVNKLFSRAPRVARGKYGETQLGNGNWAWDYLYPMAMEYYLGEKEIKNKDFRLSVIPVADDGYYRAKQQDISANRLDTYTFSVPEESDSIAIFVMEIKDHRVSWSEQWQRDTMEDNLNSWMVNTSTIIEDVTQSGNCFIVMKFSIIDLLSDISISNVLDRINRYIQERLGFAII